MVKYTITNKRQADETIFLTVVYADLNNLTVEIPFFMPDDMAAIELGISNRFESEKRKIEAIEKNKELLSKI
jgi:hypothetical protein